MRYGDFDVRALGPLHDGVARVDGDELELELGADADREDPLPLVRVVRGVAHGVDFAGVPLAEQTALADESDANVGGTRAAHLDRHGGVRAIVGAELHAPVRATSAPRRARVVRRGGDRGGVGEASRARRGSRDASQTARGSARPLMRRRGRARRGGRDGRHARHRHRGRETRIATRRAGRKRSRAAPARSSPRASARGGFSSAPSRLASVAATRDALSRRWPAATHPIRSQAKTRDKQGLGEWRSARAVGRTSSI